MTPMEYIRKVLQNHGRGVIFDAELAAAVFPALSDSNLRDFLIMVSPAVLQVLTREALAAPRTEEQWREIRLVGGGSIPTDGEGLRRSDGDYKSRYRKGVESLRRHVEAKLTDRAA
jgi:hypothetical protein